MEEEFAGREGSGFVYPQYDGRSIANIPATIEGLLGAKPEGMQIDSSIYKDIVGNERFEKVVLLIVDGFGYRMWRESNGSKGFFSKVAEKGVLAPITSVFPSTTAASITTLSTGLTPQEHALPEWVVYFDEVRTTINTLPFAPVDEKDGNLISRGGKPEMLYNGRTIYQRLESQGISSFTFTQRSITDSTYNNIIKRGSAPVSYLKPSDAAIRLRKTLENAKGRSYLNFYIDTIDSMTHLYGPSTEESNAEIANVSTVLQRNFLDKLDKSTAKDTLVMVTADHGHIGIEPDKITYLNEDRKLMGMLDRNSDNAMIPPTGSPRDVFLHIKEERLDEAVEYLSGRLGKAAKIMRVDDAMKEGLFGRGNVDRRFSARIGNLMLLPYGNNAIWYEHVPGQKFKLIGVHGGMSANEMLSPLGIARLSDLL